MTETYTAAQIEKIGGKRWSGKRGGLLRLYLELETWAPLIGFTYELDDVGGLRSGCLEGHEQLPAEKATGLYWALYWSRVYWQNGEIHADVGPAVESAHLAGVDAPEIVRRLHEGIARRVRGGGEGDG